MKRKDVSDDTYPSIQILSLIKHNWTTKHGNRKVEKSVLVKSVKMAGGHRGLQVKPLGLSSVLGYWVSPQNQLTIVDR